MSDIQRAGTTPRYSDYTLHNGVVYCVEVPPDEAADIRTQTGAMLASLETLLASAGSGKDRLLMATLYLTDMADYDAVNAVWEAWLPPGCAQPGLRAGGAPGRAGLESGDRGAGGRLARCAACP